MLWQMNWRRRKKQILQWFFKGVLLFDVVVVTTGKHFKNDTSVVVFEVFTGFNDARVALLR